MRQLRQAELDELAQAYQDGATVFGLAARFGIDRRTVGRHLRARGIDTTPPGMHPDDVPAAIELYESGWSLIRIAEKFSTSGNTLRRRLLAAGVVMRDAQRGPCRTDLSEWARIKELASSAKPSLTDGAHGVAARTLLP